MRKTNQKSDSILNDESNPAAPQILSIDVYGLIFRIFDNISKFFGDEVKLLVGPQIITANS